MAVPRSVPYPASPEDVPDDLTDYPASYTSQVRLLLVCLFVFLAIYFTLVLAFGGATVYMLTQVFKKSYWPIPGAIFCAFLFFLLVKGLFKSSQHEKDVEVELDETDHPTLFAFIRQLCDETGAPMPRRVYALHDVNAGMMPITSLKNLFVKPQMDLRLGLGLVNCVNLSEFKAIVAHELGHYTQNGFVDSYQVVVNQVIWEMVQGQDWLDRSVSALKQSGGAGLLVGGIIGVILQLFRWSMFQVYLLFSVYRTNVAREGEFHADLVAASVAGSDAIVHGLLRTKYAFEAHSFVHTELLKASDHKLYTSDLYFHQHAAEEILRKRNKDPNWGLRPKLSSPTAGKKVQVFDPEKEEDPGDHGDYHPANHDREDNVKERFVVAEHDERSPWILFTDPAELREKMTYKLYRAGKIFPKGTELSDPRVVQKFIDDENAETTYDPIYAGAYDGRLIDPGDLEELNNTFTKEPWTDERLKLVYRKLYTDIAERVEDRSELSKELDTILTNTANKRGRKVKKLVKELEAKLETADEWFHSLDRRAYLVFVQMAYRVNTDWYYELINRYHFHMAIQNIYRLARDSESKAAFHASMLFEQDDPDSDDVVELMHVLRDARKALKKVLRDASELDMPAMKNFEEGDRLADFLLNEDIVKELPESYVKGKWIGKLLTQLELVKNRSARLHFKSLGGILRLQEEIAWKFLK